MSRSGALLVVGCGTALANQIADRDWMLALTVNDVDVSLDRGTRLP